MKTPTWLAEEVAAQGARVLAGKATRAEAVTAMTEAITGHPEYLTDLIAADAARELAKWLRDNAASDQSPQISLFAAFPDLPREMRVAPTKTAEIAEMDAHQLDAARNMLLARTQNAIDGVLASVKREREAFLEFYEQVRPLLTDGRTVGDALAELARRAA